MWVASFFCAIFGCFGQKCRKRGVNVAQTWRVRFAKKQ